MMVGAFIIFIGLVLVGWRIDCLSETIRAAAVKE